MPTLQLHQNQGLAGKLLPCRGCMAGSCQLMATGQRLCDRHVARGAWLLTAEPSAGMAASQGTCTGLEAWCLMLWVVWVASACRPGVSGTKGAQ